MGVSRRRRGRRSFLLGSERGVQESIAAGLFRVDKCANVAGGTYPPAESAAWFLESSDADVATSRIVYGTVPHGYREVAPAEELISGACYQVTLTGTGTLRFGIDDRGVAQEYLSSR